MKKSSNPAPYLLSGLEQVSLVSLGNKNEVNDTGIIESGGSLCRSPMTSGLPPSGHMQDCSSWSTWAGACDSS